MDNPLEEGRSTMRNLANDAGNLMNSTAAAADQRYDEACKSLAAVLVRRTDLYGLPCRRAAKDSRAADGLAHDNHSQTLAIGIGAGLLVGYLVSRYSSSRRE